MTSISDPADASRRPARVPARGRYRTGAADLDALLVRVLDEAGATADRDQLFESLVSVCRLAADGADRLDLKITNAALKEMRAAFRAFAPYRRHPKVTIFGSARTLPDRASYDQAKRLAADLAARGWMVVTGAGPGIMAAGLEGAGREMSFGVNIRLPFEQDANAYIAGDPKLISMKYFFTRKLMLMKESVGFVSLPGGFGTLDETYELLTLIQTGKALPAPVVLLDEPGGTYWGAWVRFLRDEVAAGGFVNEADFSLFLHTDSIDATVEELLRFNRNFHSIRWVGDRLVIRLRRAPTDDEVADVAVRFDDLCLRGAIERSDPLPAEVADADELALPRLAFAGTSHGAGRLRQLIDALNTLPSVLEP